MSSRPRYRRAGAVLAGACVLSMLLGCTAEAPPAPFRPGLEWGPCPDDVETTFMTPHECGTLSVLADRTAPRGGTIRLFVAKVPPPEGATAPGFGTSFGPNVGDGESASGAMAAGAARMGRTSLQLEWRGSGPHNSTSLACPEVESLGVRAAGVVHDDRALQDAFVGAVTACAARLRASGIDPAHYSRTAMAQDVEDLRVAAGVEAWEMAGSYGTQSAVLLEYLTRYPGRVRAAYLDSPAFHSPAGFHGGAAALEEALVALFGDCSAVRACAGAGPDLEQLWVRALTRTTGMPLRGSATVSGRDVTVVVDAPKLVRAARFALGGEGGPLTALPRIIREAAEGRLAPELAQMVAEDPVYCSGYRPLCHDARFSLGLFLTHHCGAAPLTGPRATEAGRGTPATDAADAAYAAVFESSPYIAACEVWGVPAEDAAPSLSDLDVPLLLLSGSLDSFSPPRVSRAAASELGARAHAVEIPAGTHNVLGFWECAITTRNLWALRPAEPPPTGACRDSPPPKFR